MPVTGRELSRAVAGRHHRPGTAHLGDWRGKSALSTERVTPVMRHEGSPHLETSGYDAKPARIALTNGEEIDADHHFKTETERWVCVYENYQSGGIDYRIPLSSVLYIDTSDVSIGEESDETSTSAVSTQSEESSPVAAAFGGGDGR